MTDSMNFGPDWIRNLSSEGTTGSGSSGGTRYQLADYRYGREEMLALFDRNSKPPASIPNFKRLYSETSLLPLALLPATDEEANNRGGWQGRPTSLSGPPRGRGGSLERGGRISRGRGYQYSRASGYESGWGNGEQPDWSPRKEYNQRTMSMDNWRRSRIEEDDGWRNISQGRGMHEKWGRSTSWRGEGDSEEKSGPPERGSRTNWHDGNRAPSRRSWDDDHLPEWATENPTEGGGTFDERGAFHGSDDEQLEGKPPNKRDTGLQKSTSQQYISSKSQHPPLSTSKSTMSLINKSEEHMKNEEDPPEEYNEEEVIQKENSAVLERKKSVPNIPDKVDREVVVQERAKSEGPPKLREKQQILTNGPIHDLQRNEESDFERLQEDFVLKLVVDEELPKQTPNNFEVGGLQPPPNLVAQPIHDRWFYQDPQGQMQGPFSNIEMAEWYKAGYFSNQLKVRRQCDERFYLLGELIAICGGANPFQSGIRFPSLKNDITKMPDPDMLQFQYLSQIAAFKQAQARVLADPWPSVALQQQELAAQRLIMQQQQVPQDLQYIQQPPAANPLMHMINQMQQGNKLPGQGLVDKPPQNISSSMDPHLQLHMGNLMLQNRLQSASMSNHLPSALPPEGLSTSMPSLQNAALNPGGLPLPGMQSNIPSSLSGNITIPRPTSHGSVDQLNSGQDNDPISNLLKQLQQKQQTQQIDSLWSQNQFGVPTSAPPQQWQPPTDVPLSMWDIQQTNKTVSPPITQPQENQSQQQPKPQKVEKEQRSKEESLGKESKKKKELEEKQAKKEADEKRKQEQRKQEVEKKSAEEKKRKEEERMKKELEKAKKEAEEKRLKELEEKRKLKEQRKAEEEAKKKSEDTKKLEEERLRQEAKEMEARRQAEERRLQQEQIRIAKAAPWTQSNSNLGMSLADIQKAEREKRAQEVALQVQRLQEKEFQQQQQQQQQEKTGGIQLNWAKKPVEPRKVKSLAEIQAEEQDRLAKQAAENRLQKEKEAPPVTNNTGSIWNSQSLTWANTSNNSQWSSSNSGGFWEDPSNKQATSKPSTVSKSNSTNTVNATSKQQTQKQQLKSKTKKEEVTKTNHNNNALSADEFMNWCYKTLSNITSSVDIPTFVTFLRDIESAFDIREYCKEYLGESNATQQFASQFLEKRRSFKPKNNAHTDDMCSPAPAITPSLQHSTEFQEVKGKKQKNKKSKMFKVDARILGFNVTSAPDRINVGDRDYGDNS